MTKHSVQSPVDGGVVRRVNGTVVHLWYCAACDERVIKHKTAWAHLGVRGPRGLYQTGARSSDLKWPYGDATNPIVAAVNEAIPRNLPEQIREEACQELALAFLEGRATNLAESATEAVATARRGYQFSARMELSMDIPAPGQHSETPLSALLAASPVVDVACVVVEDSAA